MLIGLFSYAQTEINELLWNKNDADFKIEIKTKINLQWEINSEICFYRNNQLILQDSIIVNRFETRFDDFNADANDDLLVFQGSGARPNEMFNLYLYQPKTNDYKKVIGFNDHPNVSVTDKKRILSSMILAGEVSYEFFVINDDAELIDLKIKVTDENLDGKEYDSGLLKAQKYVAQQRI
jgi:hypothetical protein